jgi:uncharacterized protein involved in propanediol utilization
LADQESTISGLTASLEQKDREAAGQQARVAALEQQLRDAKQGLEGVLRVSECKQSIGIATP